jgi:glycosyltransferase involved in cell wall biosynthesis
MKVSISIITYNHEKFIRQALDSVLMQNVNFEYEIVIGEDCSTDNTRKILLEYHEKHPAKIRLLLPQKNQGLIRNFVQTYKSCKGEYIAPLDGDDYWTSSNKLRSQVEFLDRHPDFSMCFHPVRVFYDDDKGKPGFPIPGESKEISTLEDLLICNFIPTCGVMFRNNLFGFFPEWYYTLGMEDWPLHVLNAQYGKIGYIDHVMGDYRIHSSSAWSSKNEIYRSLEDIKFYKCIDSHLNFKYHNIVNRELSKYYYKLATLYNDNGENKIARKYSVRSFLVNLGGKDIPKINKIKQILQMYNPFLYDLFRKVKHGVVNGKL